MTGESEYFMVTITPCKKCGGELGYGNFPFVCPRCDNTENIPLTQKFKRLAKAANGAWDGVDAEQYVQELRDSQISSEPTQPNAR